MISTALLLTTVAFVLSLACNGLAIGLARRVGLVDRPDGQRKLQREAIPLAGGIAIAVATTLTIAGALVADSDWRATAASHLQEGIGLFLSGFLIVCLGVVDDYGYLRGRQKLVGQIAAAMLVVAFGVNIDRVQIFHWSWELGLLSVPCTVFWLVGAMNALNLLDGIDGLVGSLGIVLSSAIGAMSFLCGHETIGMISAVLAGSLVGFLWFNRPPAKIYLGDAGSMLIGLIVGVLAIQASLKGPGTVLMAAPLVLWTIPIFDSTAAMLRRKLTGRSMYATDRAHLHHHLVNRVGHKLALVCLTAAALLTSAAVLLSVWWKNDLIAIVCGASVVTMFVSLQIFGHTELRLLLARGRGFLRSIFARKSVDPRACWDNAVRLQGNRRWESLWEVLTDTALNLDLVSVDLDVNLPRLGEGYHASWKRPFNAGDDQCWHLNLPLLSDNRVMGCIRFVGERGGSAAPNLERLIELIEEIDLQALALATAELRNSSLRPVAANRDADDRLLVETSDRNAELEPAG